MMANMTVERYIASICLLLLVVTAAIGRKHADDEYSEEDLDYEKDFESYPENYDGGEDLVVPLILRGKLRKFFLIDTALSNPSKSVICSPISALLPIGKLAIGAEGQCLHQLLTGIGIDSLSMLKKEFKPMIKRLGALSGVTLSIFSKIFVSKDIDLQSKFKRRAKKIFDSAVEKMDFNDPTAAANEINRWTRDQTYGKIPRIIMDNEISSETSMILVNAVYFSGTWLNRFKKVKVDKFFTAASTRFIPMMTREGYYYYARNDNLDAQVVEIPYKGGKAAFVIVLPNSKEGLPVLLHKLKVAPELLQDAMSNLNSTDLILSIPKFKTETEINLKDSYEKLGISEIFKTKNSGLRKIVKGNKNIFVSNAIQKAIIEVNEDGTEAAAASAAYVATLSGSNLYRTIFNANHPFMYFITFKKEQIFSGVFNY